MYLTAVLAWLFIGFVLGGAVAEFGGKKTEDVFVWWFVVVVTALSWPFLVFTFIGVMSVNFFKRVWDARH